MLRTGKQTQEASMRIAFILSSLLLLAACDVPFVPLI